MNITEGFLTLLPDFIRIRQAQEQEIKEILIDFAQLSKQQIEDHIFVYDACASEKRR